MQTQIFQSRALRHQIFGDHKNGSYCAVDRSTLFIYSFIFVSFNTVRGNEILRDHSNRKAVLSRGAVCTVHGGFNFKSVNEILN